ncbi:MAG: protein-export chaperone SecB, partial [Microvirga sp.]
LLFPFARQMVADAVRNGGFPPLYIDPIDFVSLYRQRAAEMQGAGGGAVSRLTDAERDAHLAFIASLGVAAIWRDYVVIAE